MTSGVFSGGVLGTANMLTSNQICAGPTTFAGMLENGAKALGQGFGQGIANIANAGTDMVIGIPNLVPMAYNYMFGWVAPNMT